MSKTRNSSEMGRNKHDADGPYQHPNAKASREAALKESRERVAANEKAHADKYGPPNRG